MVTHSSARSISFRNDVMPVLSKAGCNAGSCHGNQNGKGGFKLSLRGEAPDLDYQALTRDLFGRRTNPADPDQSLVLLKATTQIAHEGGLRFHQDSPEYRTLRDWIAAKEPDDCAVAPRVTALRVIPGEKLLIAPANKVRLRAQASFSDGRHRDVTRAAVYEPSSRMVEVSPEGVVTALQSGEVTVLVRFLEKQVAVRLNFVPSRPGFVWKQPPANNFIDEEIFAKLRLLRINPSELCSDNDFVRRAYLDLLGLPPTGEEAKAFVSDPLSGKRARLVDTLLARPEFADFWTLKWADVLRTEEKVLDAKGVKIFHRWIRQGLLENKPIDVFVREVVSARGSTYTNPPANYYRALREPALRSEATAQLFLGTRLQCAKCHNHPYDHWTQADYYDWADVFSRIQYRIVENNKRDNLDSHEFIGEQFVYLAAEGELKNPRTGQNARPRLLGMAEWMREGAPAEPVAADSTVAPGESSDRLKELGRWLTSPTNSTFSEAQANRVWFHLMGRGLVDPIDDFRPTNPASHPILLRQLGQGFAKSGFDLRWLIRQIMNSRTYQLSAEPNEGNREDEINYSHVVPRRLSAEQLFDSLHAILDVPALFPGYPIGTRAAQVAGGTPVRRRELRPGTAEMFLATFGKPARLLACECERSSETTLNQVFQLVSGPSLHELLVDPDNCLAHLLSCQLSDQSLAETLYWITLSRPPGTAETEAATRMLHQTEDRRGALEDLVWALLNSKEFVLRR